MLRISQPGLRVRLARMLDDNIQYRRPLSSSSGCQLLGFRSVFSNRTRLLQLAGACHARVALCRVVRYAARRRQNVSQNTRKTCGLSGVHAKSVFRRRPSPRLITRSPAREVLVDKLFFSHGFL